MKKSDVALARLVAQRLVGNGFDQTSDVVAHMTCMQGQDIPGARMSVALRTKSRVLADVDAAFNSGDVVRSWPMRGTAHFVMSEDIGWMLGLTRDRILKAAMKRHEADGRPPEVYEKIEVITRDYLKGKKSASRIELSEFWRENGFVEDAMAVYRNVFVLVQRLVVVQGPVVGGDHHFVLYDDWVKSPRKLAREAALVEWASRYFKSHGPAPAKDFAWWTKVAAPDVKAAVAGARDVLLVEVIDGVECFMSPDLPDKLSEFKKGARKTLLLPGFDEFVLGYGNRDPFLDPAHAQKLVPGNNGMFKASVVSNGQILGTWKHKGSGAKRTFDPSMWVEESPVDTALAYENLPK